MGFDSPSRYVPKHRPTALQLMGTSLGVPVPFNAHGGESPRLAGHPVEPPGFPGSCQLVPPSRLRCRSQAFPTSQRLVPPSALLPCFRQVALVGFHPPGDCSSHEALAARHRQHALLTFLPAGCARPLPRRGLRWARLPMPRITRQEPLSVFRAFVRVRIGPPRRNTISVQRMTCPSWAFASPWY